MNQPTTPAVGAAMLEALTKANIPLRMPGLPERVWLWLRDNPHRTVPEIAAALHEPEQSVYATVHKMYSGKPSMLSRQRGSRQGKGIFEYSSLGREYQPSTLPRSASALKPRGESPAAPAGTVMQAVRVESEPAAAPVVRTTRSHGVDLESLTLGQLKALRDDLNQLFGAFK